MFRTSRHTPACSFCKKAGHTLKTCATLAAVKCGYCHEMGHTTRHCRKIAAKNMRRRTQARVVMFSPDADGFVRAKNTSRRPTAKRGPSATLNLVNTFSHLDKETAPKKKAVPAFKTFPRLSSGNNGVTTVWPSPTGAWKTRLASSTPIKKTKLVVVSPGVEQQALAKAPKKRKKYIGSWADAADEESDGDDDYLDLFLGSY